MLKKFLLYHIFQFPFLNKDNNNIDLDNDDIINNLHDSNIQEQIKILLCSLFFQIGLEYCSDDKKNI